MIASISAGIPAKCTTMTALVLGVSTALIDSAVIAWLLRSTSANIGDAPAEPAAPEEPESNLLAAPGSREDDTYDAKFQRAKGKVYIPKSEKDDGRHRGGLRRHHQTLPGYKKLKSLSRGIVEEDNDRISEFSDTSYLEEEKNIFALNNEVSNLIESLNNRKKNDETKAQ